MTPPEKRQVPALQTPFGESPGALPSGAQHGCPGPPQAMHLPTAVAEHPVAGAEQKGLPPSLQQGWLRPPHVPHAPFVVQVPPAGQVAPLATQRELWKLRRTQQPPAQRLPGQQALPASPHFTHVLPKLPTDPLHTKSAVIHAAPD
jgi:hypothetical protein